jgi:hypothetical protein
MKLAVLLLSAGAAWAQTGTIEYVPPTAAQPMNPGAIKITAGSIACDIVGNWVPANWIIITCRLGGNEATVHIPVGDLAYTFSLNGPPSGQPPTDNTCNGPCKSPRDAITFGIVGNGAGMPLNWQAAATPAGGMTASSKGTL